MVVEYGGVSPLMAATGQRHEGCYEFEDIALTSILGAAETSLGMFKRTLRRRMTALSCVHQ